MKTPIDSIIPGNCIEKMAELPSGSVDLVFADPPYNMQLSRDLYRPNLSKVDAVDDRWDKFETFQAYDDFTKNWLTECRRVLKDTGTIWVIGSYHNIFRVGTIMQDLGFWILNDIIWIKDNPMPNFRGVRFTNAHETLIWAQKIRGKKYTFNHHVMKSINGELQMRSDWYLPLCTGSERIRENGEKVHTAQKPESLLYRILLSSTETGAIILDPFFGTGTTGAVAKKLHRHYIGIESQRQYIKAAQKRIKAVNPVPIHLVQVEKKKPRIPFGTLIETGLLSPGDQLIFSKDQDIRAIILPDGRIQCSDLIGSIHGVAKSLVNNAPANGWDLWLYNDNGKLTAIDNLRQHLRREDAKNETKEATPKY